MGRLAERLAAEPEAPPDASVPELVQQLDDDLAARVTACHALATTATASGASVTLALGALHAAEFHDGLAFQTRVPGSGRLLGDGGSYRAFTQRFLGRSLVEAWTRACDGSPPPPPRSAASGWGLPRRCGTCRSASAVAG